MRNFWIGCAAGWLLWEATKKTPSIGALHKQQYIPVYRALPSSSAMGITNIAHAKNRSGVYLIKENGEIVYVGYSAFNLYKTIIRHFESWQDSAQQQRISYRNNLRYADYTVRIVFTAPAKAPVLEEALILKHRPRDNKNKLSLYSEAQTERALQEYAEAPVEKVYDFRDEDIPF